jgi:hypothetical protein
VWAGGHGEVNTMLRLIDSATCNTQSQQGYGASIPFTSSSLSTPLNPYIMNYMCKARRVGHHHRDYSKHAREVSSGPLLFSCGTANMG